MTTIIAHAIERLKIQGETPLSPGVIDAEGKIRLCTAAAVASAGLEERFGPEASRDFERQLTRSTGAELLSEAFVKLALPVSLCEAFKIYNDSIAPERRREAVIDFLSSLPRIA